MLRTILLLGLMDSVVTDVKNRLAAPDVQVLTGTGLEELRVAFSKGGIDAVIMGAGIDLETRVGLVREVFTLSNSTSVHMKDRDTGPGGYFPFVQSTLDGLRKFWDGPGPGPIP